MKEIDNNNKSFEEIKHIDENGVEFWYARELMPILQYSKWENLKKVIALAQTYFAVQTRKQEITEKEYSMLTEDEKRFYQRNLTRKGNYSLNQTAKRAGVKNFDKFHNAGYKGLYNGETADDIAKRKGLRYREDILDNMGSDELIANLFRISQTEQRLKKDNVDTEKEACKTHNKIGKIVRNAIKQAGRKYARRFAYT